MTTPDPTTDEPPGNQPQRDILSLAEPVPPRTHSRLERIAASAAPAATKAWAEGRRLVRILAAGTRAIRASAARFAGIVRVQAGAVLGPWRKPIVHGLRRVGREMHRVLRRIRLRHALIVTGAAGTLLAIIVIYSIATLPLNGGLQVDPTPSALVLEADGGETFATRGVFKGSKLTAADMPEHLGQAIIAIEDRRFHEHLGIDPQGIVRAAWRNWQAGETREGGSTITQQLVRLMFLSPEQNLRRKIQEAILSLWLERQASKEEILVRYLNTAYFGAGAYGVDAAARRYFGKATKDLSLAEAALLAGLVRAPSQLAPTRNLGGAKERADTVLQAMVETGAITPEQADAARAEPVSLRTPPETPPGTNYFVDIATADARRLLGGSSGDLTLRTTLDLELQQLAEGVIARRLEAEGRPKNASQAALVALAPDGAIRALVGGRDYEASQFNRATQARRRAGSLFKLFVYLAALQRGYTPQSTVVDEPTRIGDWEPQNASGRFKGPVPLRAAFAQSINTVAAQLADEVGIEAVIETAKRLGVRSELPAVPSLALGAAEVTLLEMTRAYAVVATGNETVEPYTVRSIQGGGQQVLVTRPAPTSTSPADLGESRGMMLDLLQAVTREGTGKAARLPNIQAGGKTGTTQEYRDAWFIGFTPDLIVGVWVGNDDNTPMNKVVGGDLPAQVWRDFQSRAAPLLARKRQAPAHQAAPEAGPRDPVPSEPGDDLVRGVPEVLDTGTLAIRGTVIRLEGIQGERGNMARQLARFLRRREVACAPGETPGFQRCRIGSHDLSAIILAAGGGRATPDAPEELQAAEDQARSARLGVWRRRR
ncbi:PBP1A family penicillin-binding protein [Microvirga massiliensis]|uniref:PBP1A family penicillin-binding protein n=1 Tax=Microvirga massiliensis TaxID=1033741 RepID=UPI0007C80143|nr:PBP1A family penicillin-binding protein [Microvirga massiliensis]